MFVFALEQGNPTVSSSRAPSLRERDLRDVVSDGRLKSQMEGNVYSNCPWARNQSCYHTISPYAPVSTRHHLKRKYTCPMTKKGSKCVMDRCPHGCIGGFEAQAKNGWSPQQPVLGLGTMADYKPVSCPLLCSVSTTIPAFVAQDDYRQILRRTVR